MVLRTIHALIFKFAFVIRLVVICQKPYKMKKSLLTLTAFTFLAGQIAQAQSCPDVCPAIGQSSAFEWIQGLQLGPLQNISGDNGGYADFGDSFQVTYTAGTTYSFTGVVGFPQGPFSETWVAWMDFNQDGDFDDAGEELFNIFGQTQVTGSFAIPATAFNGSIKLRVAMGFSVPQLCQNLSEGEIEDYCVTIEGGIPNPNICSSSEPVTGLSSTVNASNVVLSWNPIPNSVGCRVTGGLSGNFNATRNVIGDEASSVSIPLSSLSAGTYNWQVVCGCSLNPPYDLTPASEVDTFVIPSGMMSFGSQSLSQNLSLSPNPTNSALNVSVTAERNANEQIRVTDLTGRTVMQENVNLVEGLNNILLDVNGLSAGTYILILRNETDQITSTRFIKE